MNLYLIRHGETDWNNQGRIQGWIDVGINQTGREQARQLLDHFSRDRRFSLASSSLRRARETAEILGERLQIQQKWILKEFRELNQGHWNGLLERSVRRLDSKRYEAWRVDPTRGQPPGGESLKQVRARVRDGLGKVVSKAQYPVLIVAHKVVNSLISHLAGEWPLRDIMDSLPSNAAVYQVEVEDFTVSHRARSP